MEIMLSKKKKRFSRDNKIVMYCDNEMVDVIITRKLAQKNGFQVITR